MAAPARTILFTGFPGFIGKRLVTKILLDDPGTEIICLVQPKFYDQARAEIDRIRSRLELRDAKLSATAGDITDPKLGAGATYDELTSRVTEVWHLAAIYDLAVAQELARRINVDGTRHVLDFCRAAKGLSRLVYFSTCYVSGDRTGLIREDELIMGQSFKNFYESTKFAAELLVRMEMDRGLKAIIIRPGIVVGDSKTGETDKFDGPYLAFNMATKLKATPGGLPMVGPSDAEVNIVPVDYLVDATVALAKKPEASGMTFQINDPTALKASELYDMTCRLITGKGPAPYIIPPAVMGKVLDLGPVKRWLATPKEILTYFNHRTKYDGSNTARMLSGTGVTPPNIRDYWQVLYRYWRDHKSEPGYGPKA